MTNRTNPFQVLGRVASTAFVLLVVAPAVVLVGVRLVGFEVYTVLSGSMEPAYRTGSLIWVQKCEPEEIEAGDPITFVFNEDLEVATHRVIGIDAEGGCFHTQGDANDAPDGSPVLFENLIGKPVFTVPYLGFFVSYIQRPPGLYVALIVCAAALVLMFVSDFLKGDSGEAEGVRRARSRRGERIAGSSGVGGNVRFDESVWQGAIVGKPAIADREQLEGGKV